MPCALDGGNLMRVRTSGFAVAALVSASVGILAGCGPEAEMAPPPPPPPPPPPATTPAAQSPAPAPVPEAPKPSMAELQKKALTAYIAAFNAHDAKKIAELYKVDAV